MAGDLVISTINGGAIGAKNAIINGNFGINQRGASGTVVLSAGVYGHDRWKAGASGCTYTFATTNNVTTITITAGSLMQVIEGINLQSGTYTLSWAGTAQGQVDGGGYAGSGLTGTAVGGTNQTVEFGTGTVSLVQYEAGSVATPFEHRQYGQELALCQRYYEKSYDIGVVPGSITASGTIYRTLDAGPLSFASPGAIRFKVNKRATPSVLVYGTNTGASGTINLAGVDRAAVVLFIGETGASTYVDNISGGTAGSSCSAHYTASAEL